MVIFFRFLFSEASALSRPCLYISIDLFRMTFLRLTQNFFQAGVVHYRRYSLKACAYIYFYVCLLGYFYHVGFRAVVAYEGIEAG